MKLQLAIFDEDDLMLADWSAFANRLLARQGPHGFESLDAGVVADVFEVADLLRDKRPHRIQLNYGIWPVWDGRLEDLAAAPLAAANSAVGGGFDVAGLGYWRGLRDVPYTALWSWKSYSGYYRVTEDDLSNMSPGKWVIDNNNRIYIAPVSGEAFGTGGALDVGAMVFWSPHLGDRKIKKITFSYNVDLPTGWKAQVVSFNEGFTSTTTEHSITTSGSGSATVTLGTDKDGFLFQVFNDSGSKGTYTGETDDKFAKWTSVRVWTTDSAAVYGGEIVAALVGFVTAVNPGQLSSSVAQIQSPGVDLTDELYEDAWPADIATDLAGRGNSGSPPVQYEVGVGLDKVVYFRPVGDAARTWVVDVADLVLERSLEPVANSVYAVYEDGRGRLLRTAASSNGASVLAYGLTRRRAVQARTTSLSQAQTERDAELARAASPPPRASRLRVLRITTRQGLEVWPWEPRPGDVIEVANVPAQLTAGVDDLMAFTADRIEYDPFGRDGRFGSLSIETRSLSPTVAAYLAGLVRSSRAKGFAGRDTASVLVDG